MFLIRQDETVKYASLATGIMIDSFLCLSIILYIAMSSVKRVSAKCGTEESQME